MNATWSENKPQKLSDIDISVAVATDKGLITPIVKNAIGKGLVEISTNVKVRNLINSFKFSSIKNYIFIILLRNTFL